MEDIERWNMFNNDPVDEEADELLTDELVCEYKKNYDKRTAVKGEASDEADDCNAPLKQAVLKNDGGPKDHTSESNIDNELFKFSLEPDVEMAVPPEDEDGNLESSEDPEHRIDYDCAITYVCPACGYELNSHEKWKEHIDFVHKYSTRRGLNFVQLDKLYHQCLECKRKIAMHSMENLIKHKFTHLPYKRAKCKICQKQYKYRQDIMVHLRMAHRDELVAISKTTGKNHNINQTENPTCCPINFEIKNIQENAIDIFESTVEGPFQVKSEPLCENEDNAYKGDCDCSDNRKFPSSSTVKILNHFEESLSRSSHHSDISLFNNKQSALNKEELCEQFYIQYICPQCGSEFPKRGQWRQHIEYVHNFDKRKVLNFKEINMKQNAQCLECGRVINDNVTINLQLHKFTHLPYKSWLRCKLCYRTFVGQKEIVKHLLTQHRLGEEIEGGSDEQDSCFEVEDEQESATDRVPAEHSRDDRPNDYFEPHIDYLCPQCGKEYFDKRLWRKHIVKVHHLTDMSVLNFKVISERQVVCLECSKIITNAYGVQNAQQHKFTHLPYKSYVRCRLCSKCYTDRKGLVKHLRSRHHLGDDVPHPYPTTSYSPSLQEAPVQMAVQKEIVKHADVTFEIKYLNDVHEHGNDANDSDVVLDDDSPVPELTFNVDYTSVPSLKCKQCVLKFSTQQSLETHIAEEHEFLDFNNLRPLPEGPRAYDRMHHKQQRALRGTISSRMEEAAQLNKRNERHDDILNSNDSNNDLLVSTGNEINSNADDTAGIERNFLYLCPNCGLECATQMLWRRHINEVHNYDKRNVLNFRQIDKFRYQCLQCSDIVSSSKLKGLQDHKFRHLSYRLYIKCLLCGTCYNHKPNMVSHLRQRHNIIDTGTHYEASFEPGNNNKAPKALSKTLSSSSSASTSKAAQPKANIDESINYHNAVDHETIAYFCPQCNENFLTHVQWRKHIVEQHNLNNRVGLNFRQIDEHHFLCLQCYKRVTVTHTKGAIGQLQSHKFRHLPYKSFKCKGCNTEFVRKQMFFKHLNRNTNMCDQKPYNSAELDEDYNDPPTMSSKQLSTPTLTRSDHENTSSSSENNTEECFVLICPQCGLQFNLHGQWREHISKVHDLMKREVLNFKRFNSNIYECQQCLEQVVSNKLRDLQLHKFKHLPFPAYIQCRYCDATYTHMSNMQEHLKLKHRNIANNNTCSYNEIISDDCGTNDVDTAEQFLLG